MLLFDDVEDASLLLLRGFKLVTDAIGCALVASAFLLLLDVALLFDVLLVAQQEDDDLSLLDDLFEQQEAVSLESFASFEHELVVAVV